MRVVVLVEDETFRSDLEAEHGLSFHIERGSDEFLFDVGASSTFVRNAKKLGVDVSRVGKLFLSHGHRDHTGGLSEFLRNNSLAEIYGTPLTFQSYYALRKNGKFEDIGTPSLSEFPNSDKRFVLTQGIRRLEDNSILFSDVSADELRSQANDALYEKREGVMKSSDGTVNNDVFRHDRFLHEQNLIMSTEDGKKILFVGCSHRGIVNIMSRCVEILGEAPYAAIGGFHLMIPSLGQTIPFDTLDKIAERLASWNTFYFTGHCAGRSAYERVKTILGERIQYFGTGDSFEF